MILKLKTRKTKRKFYGKWLYKVSLRLTGAAVFRNQPLKDVELYCLTRKENGLRFSLVTKILDNRENIIKVARFLLKYDADSWAQRIESESIDLYTNDLDFYTQVSQKFGDLVTIRHEPDPASLDSLDLPETIVAKKLPHNRYNYRVYLLPHKFKGDKEAKTKYVDWLKQQNGRVTITPAVENWILNTDYNWDRRYVLVEDESTLLLLKLRNSEVVGRVYKFVIPINT